MKNTIVTYETFHGSAKKIGEVISKKLDCNLINIDTPYEAENLKEIDNIILVFNFRGPYTARLTKLYLDGVKEQLKDKNVILVGEGIFSEKEFPIVAGEINKNYPSRTFNKFFVNGQLRVETLSKEEKALLDEFSRLTGMEITDMGELDLDKAAEVAGEIEKIITSEVVPTDEVKEEKSESKTKWKCPLCGYIHEGDTPPEKCPLCGAPGDTFIKIEE